jgi:hypothetical protein
MAVSETTALRKAGNIIADEARKIASTIGKKTHTGKIAASIEVSVRGSKATISAGGPSAPAAAMFEKAGARHPLFGNEEHWYTQPYRPFLEEAAEAKAEEAMQAYADEMIPKLLDDSGI